MHHTLIRHIIMYDCNTTYTFTIDTAPTHLRWSSHVLLCCSLASCFFSIVVQNTHILQKILIYQQMNPSYPPTRPTISDGLIMRAPPRHTHPSTHPSHSHSHPPARTPQEYQVDTHDQATACTCMRKRECVCLPGILVVCVRVDVSENVRGGWKGVRGEEGRA